VCIKNLFVLFSSCFRDKIQQESNALSVIKNLANKKFGPILLLPLLIHIVGLAANGLVLYALDLGSSAYDIATISIVGSTMELAILLPTGFFSDRYGRKKMLLISQLLLFIGDSIRLMASKPWHLLAASFFGVGGISETLSLVASFVGDLAIEPLERVSVTNAVYFCSSLGMVVGPTVAGILLLCVKIKMLFYISFFLRLGFVLYILFIIKEPRQIKAEKISSYKTSLVNLIKNRNMLAAISVQIFLFAMLSTENIFMPILARGNFSLSDSQIVSLRSVRNLANLLFRLFSNEIFNRIKYKRLIILLFAVSSPTFFAIPFSTNYGQLLALYFVWGFCFGGLYLLSGVVTSLVSDRSNRGAAFALNSFSSASGNLSSIIMAPIASAIGVSFVFNIGAMLPIIPILLVYKLMAGNKQIG